MPNQLSSDRFLCTPEIRAVLKQLLEARRGAEALPLDIWTFAVEMSYLLDLGCTMTHLRILIGFGYIEHAEEITKPTDETRCFQSENPMKFGAQTCFVLTEDGVRFLEEIDSPGENGFISSWNSPDPLLNDTITQDLMPFWDSETRELRVGDQLVKRFTRPAPISEVVLASFQELNWPKHLDDPLPPERSIVPEERLRDTIRRLNRCQKPQKINFTSDGLGAGIRWDWSKSQSKDPTDEPRINPGKKVKTSK
jgi:hypothetical protein